MTKISKLSLAAAICVAGMSSVNAKPLSEAIEGIDISGDIRYRIYEDLYGNVGSVEDKSKSGVLDSESQRFRINTRFKIPISDTVSAKVNLALNGDEDAGANDANEHVGLVTVTEANFNINQNWGSVILGKQGIATPVSSALITKATGVMLKSNMGVYVGIMPSIGGVGTEDKTYVEDTNDITLTSYILGVDMPVNDMINLAATYIGIQDSTSITGDDKKDGSTHLGLKVSADLGVGDVALRYTSKDPNLEEAEGAPVTQTQSLVQVSGNIDAGPGSVSLGYSLGGKEGARSGLDFYADDVSLAKNDGRGDGKDRTHIALGYSLPISDSVSIDAFYSALEYEVLEAKDGNVVGDTIKITDPHVYINHKVGEKLSMYYRIGIVDSDAKAADGKDPDEGMHYRINAHYSF